MASNEPESGGASKEMPSAEDTPQVAYASAYNPVSVNHLHSNLFEKGGIDMALEVKMARKEAAEEAKRQAEQRKLEDKARKAAAEEERRQQEAMQQAAAAEPSAAAAMDGGGAQAKARAVRKKKKVKEDIFHDFGKEHDDAPIQEVKDQNGLAIYKLNYKRYWQSDRDLKRWGEALSHNIRYEKLIFQVRERWHEDMIGDRLDLKCKHSAMHRARTAERFQSASGALSALQLKDLQKMIAPKDNKKKKALNALGSVLGERKQDGGGLFAGLARGGGDEGDDDVFGGFGAQGQAAEDLIVSPTARSDTGGSALDTPGRHRPSHGSCDDHQELSASASSPALRSHSDKRHGAHLEMPSTMALLLFRNGERNHAGETLFIKRWPPAGGFKELLQLAGEACKPVIAPARALYDTELRPVRSLEEIVPGGTYMLKGLEGFDPPKLFFQHEEYSQEASLRSLTTAKRNVAAQRDVLDEFSQVPSAASTWSKTSMFGVRQPTMDSPPWPSKGIPALHSRQSKWQVDDFLGMKMSWGGQGQPHTHYHFDKWQPVLQSSYAYSQCSTGSPARTSIDRHSSSPSF
eukprot:TRINITY_DN6884_c0_g1_i1.p1 TRINITY_DN6884_c0_g1~~TRINITY_DN6884_c0_g1_i1.p1  ORF type:complete len:575 (+),score=143.36 TRINITY_DN6884_c0_g1_i1:123-1847(+)